MSSLDAFLGQNSANGLASVVVTTTAPAASGTRIIAYVSWFHPSSASMTVSGGTGMSWSSLGQVNNGSDRYALWTSNAPSGLASGQAVTATSASGAGGVLMSLTSAADVGTIDVVGGGSSPGATGANWSTGSIAPTQTGGWMTGGSGNETATTTSSTPTNGTEITGSDAWNSGAGQGAVAHYLIPASTASQALTGTWSTSSTANTGLSVSYNPGTPSAPASPTWSPHRMPLGV
jgi:hypothetical protein